MNKVIQLARESANESKDRIKENQYGDYTEDDAHRADQVSSDIENEIARIVACVNACEGVPTEELVATPVNSAIKRVCDLNDGLSKELEDLKQTHIYMLERSAQRSKRLWVWAHDELSAEQQARYFNIVANGTADAHEQPTYAQQMNTLKHERDDADRRAGAAERQLAEEKKRASYRNEWLRKAKESWGAHENISFDAVWDEALVLKAQRDELLATLTAIVDLRHGRRDSDAVKAQGQKPMGDEDAMVLWAQQAITKVGGAA